MLAGATALAVAAPAVASAATTLTLTPSSVPAASTSTNIDFNYGFSPASSNITTELPAGLLADGTLDGGACLVTPVTVGSTTPPSSACQVGTGMLNGAVAVTLYLVAAPHTGDLAGVDLFAGAPVNANAAVGDITTRTTDGGLNLAFTGLSTPTSALDVTFTHLRMPTSCPSTPANVTVMADSGNVNTPLTVTGCSSLAYNPNLSATVKRDSSDTGAEVVSTITQPNAGTESATKASTLVFGSTLNPNTTAVAACFVSACQVGTATATSPLLPSAAFSGGTVTLGGTIVAPTLTIHFPVLNLSLVGAINLAAGSVTFNNEPDFPLTMLTVDVTGPSTGGKAFTTTCTAGNLTGAFTPWDGNAVVNKTAPIQYQGCPATAGKPTASGALSGLGNGHPKLKLKVKHGTNAPNISSVSIKPASGLKFKCVKSGKSCKGLSVSGGTVKSAKVSGGQLVIKLKKSASSVTVKAKGPAITESSSLLSKVKKHKIKKITLSIKVKDSSGTTTTVKLKLKA